MARLPRRQGAVATALQGGRPKRDGVRRLLQSAAALGGAAIDLLLLRPLRRIWRWIRSRIASRRGSLAARMAKRAWRDDDVPARDPRLRRAVARAGSAIQAMGRRALAVIRNLPQRALSVALDLLQRPVPDFVCSLLRPRRPCPRQRPETPPTPTKKTAGAWKYKNDPLRRRAPAPPTPPLSPPRRDPVIVDGEVVPEEVVDQYITYCSLASSCSANSTVCHFCVFYIQKSRSFTAPTAEMFLHCSRKHVEEEPSVRCDVVGCSVRVHPGRELALHKHFCHVLAHDWWMQIKQNQKAS